MAEVVKWQCSHATLAEEARTVGKLTRAGAAPRTDLLVAPTSTQTAPSVASASLLENIKAYGFAIADRHWQASIY